MRRFDEAFLLGAMAGALVVWLWRPTLEDDIDREPRRVRTPAAGSLPAVEATTT